MVSFFVVFEHPVPGDFSDLVQIPEQPSVQNLIPIGPIESLNIGILIRLSWFNVINENTVLLAPIGEHTAEKFRAIVCSQYVRLSSPRSLVHSTC